MTDHLPKALPRIRALAGQVGFNMELDPALGALLRVLAASKPGGHFLELGTGLGAGSAFILEGMDEDAGLITVELSHDYSTAAQQILGGDTRITFVAQDGGAFLTSYNGPAFDLIFADAMPGKFDHLDEALSLLAPGGVYVGDDLHPQANWPDGHPPRVEAFIKKMTADPRFTTTVLDWASGILLAVRKPSSP